MLMFAYGSNLDIAQMKRRAPDAKPLASFTLTNARLIFRGVADVVYDPDSEVVGGVWKISPADEAALDLYEGVASGMYRRTILPIKGFPGEPEVLLYQMNSEGIYPPSFGYLETIRQGYADFNLPTASLEAAVRASWDGKKPSHIERKRTRRTGRPILAKRDGSAALRKPKRPGSSATGKHADGKETT